MPTSDPPESFLTNGHSVLARRDRILDDLRDRPACEVTVSVGEEAYLLDRRLLSSFSPYFQAMFSSSFRESRQSSVRLHDVEAEPFRVLLDFMSGEDKLESHSHDLIIAAVDLAEVLCVDLFVSYYEHELESNLRDLDLTLAFRLCERLGKDQLREEILKTVEESLLDMHYRTPKTSRNARVYAQTSLELLTAAIRRPKSKLVFNPEFPCTCSRAEKFLDGVLHWVGSHPAERFEDLDELLRMLWVRGLSEYSLLDAAVRVLGKEVPGWLRDHAQRVIRNLLVTPE